MDVTAWPVGIELETIGRFESQATGRAAVGILVLATIAACRVARGQFGVCIAAAGSLAQPRNRVALTALNLFGRAAVAVVDNLKPARLIALTIMVVGVVTRRCGRHGEWWADLGPPAGSATSSRMTVFCACETGTPIVRQPARRLEQQFLPVAIFDDDGRSINMSVIRVVGARTALPKVARMLHAETLFVVMPTPTSQPKLEV